MARSAASKRVQPGLTAAAELRALHHTPLSCMSVNVDEMKANRPDVIGIPAAFPFGAVAPDGHSVVVVVFLPLTAQLHIDRWNDPREHGLRTSNAPHKGWRDLSPIADFCLWLIRAAYA